MAWRSDMWREVFALALDSLRASKLRSALTILGVVIGVAAIVGMTSLIRGFDQSLRDSIRELGPNTIFVAKFSGISLSSGRGFAELARRPNITRADATAIEKLAPSVGRIDTWCRPFLLVCICTRFRSIHFSGHSPAMEPGQRTRISSTRRTESTPRHFSLRFIPICFGAFLS